MSPKPEGLIVHEEDMARRFPLIDWEDAFAQDFGPPDFHLGKLWERGQQVALLGDGKVGKSLLELDHLLSSVQGRSFLGDTTPRPPLKVVYFDRENNLRDIIRNLRSLGATDEDVKALQRRVIYHQFPKFTTQLDEQAGARELLALVDHHSQDGEPVDLVMLDTASRFISGEENDSRPWLALYRLVHAELKDRGIAGLRLDHFGKDRDRGARGSSAKGQDVDHEWQLTKLSEQRTTDGEVTTVATNLLLRRSETRTGIGPDAFHLTRVGKKAADVWRAGETRHGLTDPSQAPTEPDPADAYVAGLPRAGAPALGRSRLRAWAEAHRVPFPADNNLAAEVVRRLKSHQLPYPEDAPF